MGRGSEERKEAVVNEGEVSSDRREEAVRLGSLGRRFE